MTEPHPRLCFRPRPKKGLARPTCEHSTLGHLEYINRDGGWWQSTTEISGNLVRLDFQAETTRLTDEMLESAAAKLAWVQAHEPQIRSHAAIQLQTGKFRSNLKNPPNVSLSDATLLDSLRPCMIIIWSDWSDLCYDCDHLPEGELFGADSLQVTIQGTSEPGMVFLYSRFLKLRAEIILEQPIPPDAPAFENSLADQFVSKIAVDRVIAVDDEVKDLIATATKEVKTLSENGSQQLKNYLRTIEIFLRDIIRSAERRNSPYSE